MIYFPVYANMKKNVFHEGRQGKVLSLGELLISAGIGGVPAGQSSFAELFGGRLPLRTKGKGGRSEISIFDIIVFH